MRLSSCVPIVALLAAVLAGGCSRLADQDFITDSMRTGEHSSGAVPLDSLVIGSYNIQYGQAIDQAIADLRSDPMLHGAHVLLLQEMDGEGTARIAEALGYDYVYYAATNHPKHSQHFGNAVLSRAPIIEHDFIALPVESPFPVTARIAVIAEIATSPEPIVVVSIHTSTVMVERSVRLEQFQSVSEGLLEFTGPVVIGGDFNTPTYDDVRLLRAAMRDRGYRHVRYPIETAHLAWWKRMFDIRADLDHIFYQRLRLRRFGVESAAKASDHLPVWAVFDWDR